MKRIPVLLLLMILSCLITKAQATSSTILFLHTEAGSYAGLGYTDPHLGIGFGVEQKIGRHFELQGIVAASPDHKQDSNTGRELNMTARGIVWLNGAVGLVGGPRHSNLWTSRYAKESWEYEAGTVIRMAPGGFHGRLYLSYVGQTQKDYDPKTGIEGNQLKCIETYPEFRFGNLGPTTIRVGPRLDVCHGLTQGNPLQDGTLGPATAPRSSFTTGAVAFVMRFEFGRHDLNERY